MRQEKYVSAISGTINTVSLKITAGTGMRKAHIVKVVRGAHNSGVNIFTTTPQNIIINGSAYNRPNNISIIIKEDNNTITNTGKKIGLNYPTGTNKRESGDHFEKKNTSARK